MILCKDAGKKTHRYTVLRKNLDAYIKDSAELVPRQWLIDFTCDYAFRIARKSKTHRELLDKYFG